MIEGATFETLDRFANELFRYMIHDNGMRPHQAPGGFPPKDVAATLVVN